MPTYLPKTLFKWHYILYPQSVHTPDFETTLKLLRTQMFSRPYDFKDGKCNSFITSLDREVQSQVLHDVARIASMTFDGVLLHEASYHKRCLTEIHVTFQQNWHSRKDLRWLHQNRCELLPDVSKDPTHGGEAYKMLISKRNYAPVDHKLHKEWAKELHSFYDSLADVPEVQDALRTMYPLEFTP